MAAVAGSSPRRRPSAPRTAARCGRLSTRRRTCSPGRSPGRRRCGAQATLAPSPSSWAGICTVPRSVPNSRVRTATGTATRPSRGSGTRPTATAVTPAARSAERYRRTKRSRGYLWRLRASTALHIAPASRRAHAATKRCAASRRVSFAWRSWTTNQTAPPAAATRTSRTRILAPGRPPRPRRRRRPGSIHATPERLGGAEENMERRRRRRTPVVYRSRPRHAPRLRGSPDAVDLRFRSGSRSGLMGTDRVPAAEAVPEGVAFEVERFEWTTDGRLELCGRWYGLRGHRFMRPALTVDAGDARRRMLADLEHKPWAAEDGEEWIAAFPWEGEPLELAGAELAVAPTLAVDLPPPRYPNRRRKAGAPPTAGPRPARRPPTPEPATPAATSEPATPRNPEPAAPAAPPEPAPPDRAATRRLEAELADAHAAIRRLDAELSEAQAAIRELEAQRDEARERLADAQRP